MLLGFRGELPLGQFQLHEPPLQSVDFGGHALQVHGHAAGGLVDQVDRLVGQEAIGDVAMRQFGRGHQRRVLDLDVVVGLVAGFQAAEDGQGVVHRRLVDVDGLETPLQGGVLLDVLAVFVQRRGADATQITAG